MSPPKSGKSTVLKDLVRAVLVGDSFLGWPTGLSGVVWLTEEDRETFAYKRRAMLTRLAQSATGTGATSTDAGDRATSTTLPEEAPDGPEPDPQRAARLAIVYGPNLPTGLPHLAALMAEAIALCRLREATSGTPWRVVLVDSLFFWCPEAETDVQAAGRVMALLKSAAALGYRVVLVTHADPESGRQKGPQQLWRQTDYRVHLQAAPDGAPIENTPGRRLVLTGRYPDGGRPPDVTFAMTESGQLVPWTPPESETKRPDSGRHGSRSARPSAPAPEVPTSTAPRSPSPVDRLCAALPLDGGTVDLASLTIPGMGRSRVYDLAKEAEDTGRALRVTIGRRGKLGIRRLPQESPA